MGGGTRTRSSLSMMMAVCTSPETGTSSPGRRCPSLRSGRKQWWASIPVPLSNLRGIFPLTLLLRMWSSSKVSGARWTRLTQQRWQGSTTRTGTPCRNCSCYGTPNCPDAWTMWCTSQPMNKHNSSSKQLSSIRWC